MALLIPIFCAACAQTKADRVRAGGEAVGQVRASEVWPDLPADCRRSSRGGVVEGDRLDVAVLKLDDALAQQNARTARCAAWYDRQRGEA
jgi:hypothetical protein